jgi:hypothetical protein
MHLLGGADPPIETGLAEGCGGIGDDERLEAEIAGHAHSCGDAMVGGQPDHDDRRHAYPPEVGLEGSADEGAVDRLPVERLAIGGQGFRLGLNPQVVAAERTLRRRGFMVHVDHGAATRPPGGDQAGDVRLGAPIVPVAPAWQVERFLDVDDDERGVGRQAWRKRLSLECSPAGKSNSRQGIVRTSGGEPRRSANWSRPPSETRIDAWRRRSMRPASATGADADLRPRAGKNQFSHRADIPLCVWM